MGGKKAASFGIIILQVETQQASVANFFPLPDPNWAPLPPRSWGGKRSALHGPLPLWAETGWSTSCPWSQWESQRAALKIIFPGEGQGPGRRGCPNHAIN